MRGGAADGGITGGKSCNEALVLWAWFYPCPGSCSGSCSNARVLVWARVSVGSGPGPGLGSGGGAGSGVHLEGAPVTKAEGPHWRTLLRESQHEGRNVLAAV